MKTKKCPKAEPRRGRLPGKKKNIKSKDVTTLSRIPQQLARVILHDIVAVMFQTNAPLRHFHPDPRAGGVHE